MSKNEARQCCAASPADACERSCRWPLLFLFAGAAGWLALSMILALLASLKCHMPGLLADHAWLTYGRVQVAANQSLWYGFAVPAALAACLWLIVRLGGAPLACTSGILAGTFLWNLGALIGLLAILAGDATGHQGFAYPGYVVWILFVAYVLVAIGALSTFRQRQRAELHPSQWHVLTALFWFAWIWSTASILLTCVPARGIMQAVVAWWFGAQLQFVFLGFVGLAVLWLLVPETAGRPLHSRYHALLAFWLLAVLSGWRGIPQSAPVPAWMPGLSAVTSVLSVVAVLAVSLNLHHTLAAGGYSRALGSRVGLLSLVAAGSWVAAMVLGILGAVPEVSRITGFTFFEWGTQRLFVVGFFGLAAFAVLYGALPRVFDGILPCRILPKIHVGCMLAGLVIQAGAYIGLGVAQGRSMNDHAVQPFMEALRPGLMALRIATLGDLLLVIGSLALVANLGRGMVGCFARAAKPAIAGALAVQPAEVKR